MGNYKDIQPSQRFSLNKDDLKKWLRACLIWLAPLGVFYFGSVLLTLQADNIFEISHLYPTNAVINGMVLYIIERLFDLSRRFVNGN